MIKIDKNIPLAMPRPRALLLHRLPKASGVGEFKTGGKAMTEKKQICSICLHPIEGFSNNAYPVNNGRCCSDCNAIVVIPARIAEAYGRKGRANG